MGGGTLVWKPMTESNFSSTEMIGKYQFIYDHEEHALAIKKHEQNMVEFTTLARPKTLEEAKMEAQKYWDNFYGF